MIADTNVDKCAFAAVQNCNAMNLNDTVAVVAAAGVDGGQIDFDAALNHFDSAAHNECSRLVTTVDTVVAADDDQIDFDAGWSCAARYRSYNH